MRAGESLPAFYSEPQIRHLPQVLDELHRGQLLIPRFQRPLIWPKENRLALLDSIFQAIPIGTIMVWRTRLATVATKHRLGPFLLPPKEPDAPVRQYLLDGEQRLATLFFALYGPQELDADSSNEAESADDFRVYYDLRAKEFVALADIKGKVDLHHLPLTDLLQGPRLTKFQRRLETARGRYGDLDRMAELSDEVADAFRQYKLPCVPVTSDDIGLVTKTFKRINSQHVTMGEVHMVNALTWSEDFELLDRFQSIKERSLSALGWDSLEDQTILRVCKVALQASVYDDNAEDVSSSIKERPDVLREVEARLVAVAEFLASKCSIRAPELVPYPVQIVLLAAAFEGGSAATGDVGANLRDWLWFTTYTEAFQRQISEPKFAQFLSDVRMLAAGERLAISQGKPPTRRRTGRFDFRHARSRAVALLLADQKPYDPMANAPSFDGRELLAQLGVRAVPQLVSSDMTRVDVASSIGARVLARPGAVVPLRETLREPLPLVTQEFLQSHVIGEAAYKAFQRGDYVTFVKLREDDLNRLEEERFQGVLHRLYPAFAEKARR